MAESNRPTITNGDLDPATLTVVADIEKNDPRAIGINEDFLREMCIFAGSNPLPVEEADPALYGKKVTAEFDNLIIYDTRNQPGTYPSVYPKDWSTFMDEHAIWHSNQKQRGDFSITHDFTLQKTSEFLLKYQADDNLKIIIDGRQYVDYGGFRPSTQIGSTKVTLEKGNHSMTLKGFNLRGPGGIAVVAYLIREFENVSNKVVTRIPSPSTSKYIVRNETIYIRKRAADCGPDEDRTEDIEIGSIQSINGGNNISYKFLTDSFRYYGKPIVPGSYCSDGGSIGADDFWWDVDPREDAPDKIYLTLRNPTPINVNDPYGLDGDGIDDLPPITDRGCE